MLREAPSQEGSRKSRTALGEALAVALAEVEDDCGMAAAATALRKVQALVAGWWQDHEEEDFSEEWVRSHGGSFAFFGEAR
jgi:hypothetical protein